jgi:hypothetical protein
LDSDPPIALKTSAGKAAEVSNFRSLVLFIALQDRLSECPKADRLEFSGPNSVFEESYVVI